MAVLLNPDIEIAEDVVKAVREASRKTKSSM